MGLSREGPYITNCRLSGSGRLQVASVHEASPSAFTCWLGAKDECVAAASALMAVPVFNAFLE